MNCRILRTFRGLGHSLIASIVSVWTSIPFSERVWPRKATRRWNKKHFEGWSFRFAERRRSKTSRRHKTCVSKSGAKTIMSSRLSKKHKSSHRGQNPLVAETLKVLWSDQKVRPYSETAFPGNERSLVFVAVLDWDIVITRAKIQSAEIKRTVHRS